MSKLIAFIANIVYIPFIANIYYIAYWDPRDFAIFAIIAKSKFTLGKSENDYKK